MSNHEDVILQSEYVFKDASVFAVQIECSNELDPELLEVVRQLRVGHHNSIPAVMQVWQGMIRM